MKKIYNILTFYLLLTACQNVDFDQNAVGYLKLQVGTDKATITKAGDIYNPKQIPSESGCTFGPTPFSKSGVTP